MTTWIEPMIPRVLAVLGSRSLRENCEEIFHSRLLHLDVLDRQELSEEVLRAYLPDLLLLDLEVDTELALETCQRLKRTTTWRNLPILGLVTTCNRERCQASWHAGVDEVVCRPLEKDDLIRRVRARIQAAESSPELHFDASECGRFRRAVERYIGLTTRFKTALTLSIATIDGLADINESYGKQAGEEVLHAFGDFFRTVVQDEDMVARWFENDLAIGWYGRSAAAAAAGMEQLQARWQKKQWLTPCGPFRCTFSAGLAEFPVAGNKLEDLLQAAGRGLRFQSGFRPGRVIVASGTGFLASSGTIRVATV